VVEHARPEPETLLDAAQNRVHPAPYKAQHEVIAAAYAALRVRLGDERP
jgi:hypothetical protein